MKENIITIEGLTTHFFTMKGIVKAVDGVNLRIDREETVGLVGESGCGKSVTALSIVRLVPNPGRIVKGKIVFHDRELLHLKETEIRGLRGKEISMIFQDPLTFLNPIKKVGQQVGEGLIIRGYREREAKAEVLEALDKVRIPSPSKFYDYYPHQLSGGMRQRVIIAAALIHNPLLVIADEPTTSLDVTTQQQVLDLIKEIKEKTAQSMLLITHDMGIVSEVCDRVYVMYSGRIVENADVFSIFDHPRHPYTMGLLNSARSIYDCQGGFTSIRGTVPDPFDLPSGCMFHPRCTKAREACTAETPPTVRVNTGHEVSCWQYR